MKTGSKYIKRFPVILLLVLDVMIFTMPAANAYIDPSVTTYAIQAIAGVIVASGAFFAAYGRRVKRILNRAFGLDEMNAKTREPDVEILDPELKAELADRLSGTTEEKQPAAEEQKTPKHWLRRTILSLICGLTFAMTLVLRPIISFYLANEGEFWFSLKTVIGCVMLIFAGVAAAAGIIHFVLPDRKKISLRLIFASLIAAVTVCAFIQNHFMSSYLPLLTGDPIDWSKYTGWNVLSIVLWSGVLVLFIVLAVIRPGIMRIGAYCLMILLLCTETVNGTVDLATAKHENRKEDTYFSQQGLYETSTAGNIVVLISDTFEGTLMNEALEGYPELRDRLSDCTYYDNTTGISVMTYFSYAKLMTGVDFPNGKNAAQGIVYCFDNQTTVDRVLNKGWDVSYYCGFSPTTGMEGKITNYCSEVLAPSGETSWNLALLLLRSTLFQSMPQPLKPELIVYTYEYTELKTEISDEDAPEPFVENDPVFFNNVRYDGLIPVEGKPRYMIVEMRGAHSPCFLNGAVEQIHYESDVPYEERRLNAARASLRILAEYLDQLKAAGTYDDTTVIMTADHGFNLRYYPVLLVKEAHRQEEGFTIDHTPFSLQEDYEDLITLLASGKTMKEAAKTLIPDSENRTRYAMDYRSVGGYATTTYRKSIVEIDGPAREESSYRIARDEFYMDDDFEGRCRLGNDFITNENVDDTVCVYGIAEGDVHGHSVLFDAFFDTKENRAIEWRGTIRNITDRPQKVIFSIDGEELETVELAVSDEAVPVTVSLPEKDAERWTLELTLPDAKLRINETETLEWNAYDSIRIPGAGFYAR